MDNTIDRCNKSVMLLDCTLRDGGAALEDEFNHSGKSYSMESIRSDVIRNLMLSDIDVIEMGILEPDGDKKRDFSYYGSMESIAKDIPNEKKSGQMFVVGKTMKESELQYIPDRKEWCCDGIRTFLLYSELKKSLEWSMELSKRGYAIFLQNQLTMRYTDDDLRMMAEAANEMDAFAVYIVDTSGYMMPDDVVRISKLLDHELKDSIRIGFHGHNNINMAFANTIAFLEQKMNHLKMVDSCLMGMGRGGGNTQSEILIPYINEHMNANYNYDGILDACEYIEPFYDTNFTGYSELNVLASIHKTTAYYTVALREKYHYSFSEINKILSVMPAEYRHRYTQDNLMRLIRIYNEGAKS